LNSKLIIVVSRKRLEDLASANNVTIDHESFPSVLDSIDPLKSFRSQFHIPTLKSLLHSPPSNFLKIIITISTSISLIINDCN